MKRIFYFLLALVLVVLVASFLPPFVQGYELKTAARLACNDFIKAQNAEVPEAHERFLTASIRAGVKLSKKQYSFEVEANRAEDAWVCHARIRYPVQIEWAFVGQVLQEIPRPIWQRNLRLDHVIKNKY